MLGLRLPLAKEKVDRLCKGGHGKAWLTREGGWEDAEEHPAKEGEGHQVMLETQVDKKVAEEYKNAKDEHSLSKRFEKPQNFNLPLVEVEGEVLDDEGDDHSGKLDHHEEQTEEHYRGAAVIKSLILSVIQQGSLHLTVPFGGISAHRDRNA